MAFEPQNTRRLSLAVTIAVLVGIMGCQGVQPVPAAAGFTPAGAPFTPPPTEVAPLTASNAHADADGERRIAPNVHIENGVEYVYSEGAFPKQPYALSPRQMEQALADPPELTPPPGFQLCFTAGKYRLSVSRVDAEKDPYVYWGLSPSGEVVDTVWCKIPTSMWFRAEPYLSPPRPKEKPDYRHDVSKIRVVVPENKSWKISVDGYGDTHLLGLGPTLLAAWDGTVVGKFEPLPDGEYTLRLHSYEGSREDKRTQTVKVVIDTKPPEIAESHVYAIEPKDGTDDLLYSIRFDMREAEAADGSYSGIKVKSAKLEDVNVTFTPEGEPKEVQPEGSHTLLAQGASPAEGDAENLGKRYELRAVIPMVDAEEEKYDTFEYHIQVEDKAGNRSHDKSGIAAVATFTGAPTDASQVCGVAPIRGLVLDGPITRPPLPPRPAPVPLLPPPLKPPAPPVIPPLKPGFPPVSVILRGAGVIGAGIVVGATGAVAVGQVAEFSSKVLIDLDQDFRDNCLVPADDSYDHSQRTIQHLRGRTPFLCPQGDPLTYPFVLWIANKDLRPVVKAPPIQHFRLPVTVTFTGENLRSSKAPGPSMNKSIGCRSFRTTGKSQAAHWRRTSLSRRAGRMTGMTLSA